LALYYAPAAPLPSFFDAVSSGDTAAVKQHLRRGRTVNARDYNTDRTPLHYATSAGQIKMVEFLLAQGADVHAKDCTDTTALHLAAECGSAATVELLLNHNAGINATDQCSLSPLHLAARFGHLAVAELLLRRGADVNGGVASWYKNLSGSDCLASVPQNRVLTPPLSTPLDEALAGRHESIAELLRSLGGKSFEDLTAELMKRTSQTPKSE
jgi:ankyrin repeat protein